MAFMKHKVGRKEVFFTDHALDRYWERFVDQNPHAGRKEARAMLERELEQAELRHNRPSWARMSAWHAARCIYTLYLDCDRAFVINKNPSGDLLAVTYLFNERTLAHA
jgi:hypothetical protein